MNWISRLISKAQTSPDKWIESSVRVVDGAGYLGGQQKPFDADAAVSAYSSWSYAATMLNANAVASQPLRLYIRNRGGRKLWATREVSHRRRDYLMGEAKNAPSRGVCQKLIEFGPDFEEVTESHPVLELLHTANPYWNGFDLMQLITIYLELTGNAYLHPIIQGGVPAELWPMPSQWVWVHPSTDDFIDGYVYGRTDGTLQQFFELDEVIHFRTANPNHDGIYYGMGKPQAAWGVLQLNDAHHEMDLAFTKNHARPDYLMVMKSGAGADQLDRFEAVMERKLRGNRNSGRFLSIPGDVELTPMNFPPKDLAGREEVVEEIAAVWGTPVSLLKANDPNLASAEVGFASWRRQAVLPLCRLIEQKLNEQLLPLYGIEGDAVLAFDNPVPEDEAAKLAESQTLVASGIRTINEDREERGQEPIEGGDAARINGQSLETLDAGPLGFGAAPMAPRGTVGPAADAEDDRGSVGPDVIAAAVAAAVTKALMDAKTPEPPADQCVCGGRGPCQCGGACGCGKSASVLAMRQKAVDDPQDGLPNSDDDGTGGEVDGFRSRMARLFGTQADELLRNLESWEQVMADPKWVDLIADAASPFIERAIDTGGAAGANKLPLEFGWDVTNPEVQRFVNEYSVRLATAVNGSTTHAMQSIIGDGLDRGETIADITDRVRTWGGSEVAGRRAEMIARTESARAYVAGEEESWKQSGVVGGKKWLLAPNPCEFCKAAEAAVNKGGGAAIGSTMFEKGTQLTGADGGNMSLDYEDVQGPPLHPHCRCDLIPVLGDDM